MGLKEQKAAWYQKNKERIAAQKRTPEYREKHNARQKLYAAKTRGKRLAYWREYNLKNKEKIATKNSLYRASNKDTLPARKAEYVAANREKVSAYRRRYIDENKEKVAATYAEWARKNPSKVRAKTNKRRAVKLNACPPWADLEAIADVYKEAEYMQMEVDHIVPLNNRLVCGLHVWGNLQLLTKAENRAKGNKFWPDMLDAK